MFKYFLTVFVAVLVPTYMANYHLGNFLWFSDVALFLILIGTWLESAFLMSIVLVMTFFMELFWNIDFFYTLITGNNLFDIASYMFDSEKSLFLRGLSLFHVLLPIVPLVYVIKLGYHHKAFKYGLALFWILLILSYCLTPVNENINWVHYASVNDWKDISPELWFFLLFSLYPILIMIPKDYIFKKIFKSHE